MSLIEMKFKKEFEREIKKLLKEVNQGKVKSIEKVAKELEIRLK